MRIKLITVDKTSAIILPYQCILCSIYPVTAKTIKKGLDFLKLDKGMLKSLMREEKNRESEF